MSELTTIALAPKAQWLDALDPRGRILTAVIFSMVVVSLENLFLLMTAFIFSVILTISSRIPFQSMRQRILPFEGFMVLVVLFLPFTLTGNPVVKVFGLFNAYDNGIERAMQVFLRANAVFFCTLTLLASMLPETLGHALARLGVPTKLVHLYLMTVRYVSVLTQEYQRLRIAMRARAFTPGSNFHTWRSFGWLIGMLLVRSLERSERVLNAMKCRGYQGRFLVFDASQWRIKDSVFLAVVVILCFVLKMVDVDMLQYSEFLL